MSHLLGAWLEMCGDDLSPTTLRESRRVIESRIAPGLGGRQSTRLRRRSSSSSGILVTVFGGTATGAVLRDNIVFAGVVISAAWVAGTRRWSRLVRLAQRGACPVPPTGPGPSRRMR